MDRRGARRDRDGLGATAQAAGGARGVARHRDGPVPRSQHRAGRAASGPRPARAERRAGPGHQRGDRPGARPARRQALGHALRADCERVERRGGRSPRWRGLAVYGLDGSTLRVADTPENAARFGRPGSRHGEGAGYPQLRLVALSVLRHHLVAAATLGPYRTNEVPLAAGLWAVVPDRALVILDRGFCSYVLFHALAEPACQRHWLIRAKAGRTA